MICSHDHHIAESASELRRTDSKTVGLMSPKIKRTVAMYQLRDQRAAMRRETKAVTRQSMSVRSLAEDGRIRQDGPDTAAKLRIIKIVENQFATTQLGGCVTGRTFDERRH